MSNITYAINKKWDDPTKFSIEIKPTGRSARKLLKGFSEQDITVAAMSIQLPDMVITPVESWTAEQWRFVSGRLEPYQIQLTMKDYDNYHLYKTFAKAIQDFTREYPGSQMFDITVKTAADYDPNNYKSIVTFKNCMLISVAGPTLDHSAKANISEFSIIAKAQFLKTH